MDIRYIFLIVFTANFFVPLHGMEKKISELAVPFIAKINDEQRDREQFFSINGRAIVLCNHEEIEKLGQKFQDEKTHLGGSFLYNALRSNACIIITKIISWTDLLKEYEEGLDDINKLKQTLLQQKNDLPDIIPKLELCCRTLKEHSPAKLLENYDVFINENDVLVFVPKKLHAKPSQINPAIGFNLTYFTPKCDLLGMYQSPPLSSKSDVKESSKEFSLTDAPIFLTAILTEPTILKAFKQLVLNKSTDINAATLPWTILACGHGGVNKYEQHICEQHICGWLSNYFHDFLIHLNTQISTKNLLCISCQTGSKCMLLDFYNNQVFNFPIICPALFDSANFTRLFTQLPDYSSFFRYFHNTHAITIKKQHELCNVIKTITSDSPENIPRIRQAGDKQFMLMLDDTTFSSRNRQQKLHGGNGVYLIEDPIIDYPLMLDFKELFIASALPGQINHFVKHLFTPTLESTDNLLETFFRHQSNDERVYLIEQCELRNSRVSSIIIFFNAAQSLCPKTSKAYGKKNYAYFELNGKHFIAILKEDKDSDKAVQGKQNFDTEEIELKNAQKFRHFFESIKNNLIKNPHYNPKYSPRAISLRDQIHIWRDRILMIGAIAGLSIFKILNWYFTPNTLNSANS